MFKVDISHLEVTKAVMDLVMKSNKTINVFYVRVKWAMEVKRHSITMEDKALAPYIADQDQDLFTFILVGLPSKYCEFAMSGENPPTNPANLWKRCAQLEAMQSFTKRIAALSAEANEENPKAIEESSIELLTKEIAALKAEMKCFNCQKKGHFASACPDPKKPKPGRGRRNRGGRGNKENKGQGQGQRGGGGGQQGGGGYQPAPNYGQHGQCQPASQWFNNSQGGGGQGGRGDRTSSRHTVVGLLQGPLIRLGSVGTVSGGPQDLGLPFPPARRRPPLSPPVDGHPTGPPGCMACYPGR
jgi:hypothetical protein